MTALQQIRQGIAVAVATVDQAFVKRFQLMGQIANRANLGHTRTTLEGVQVTLQG